ncbi:type III-B CRISPR module-associated protein Cmr5 [Aneurinibacillus sp. UBA3580]|jgi:CRISPR-associated protein Cmr5|uniref:type III-B CRISPR module-associated protein Cmr5 n=1 Tax=Aneurinibacillus sp. UBA3580 TaxID=1946041 RepID=UPI00257F569F|nr:type III-B CRISPR module-associated protein Cmr5 [Aneurinibacillus sp. UBA3580]
MSRTILKGIEQGRADYAFQCAKEGYTIKKGATLDGVKYSDTMYKSYVKKIPSLIKTNGLGATLAFVFSKAASNKQVQKKGKNAYDLLYKQIHAWLVETNPELFSKNGNLVEEIVLINSSEYRTVTMEVLALLTWVRRFAEGLDKTEEDME